jgi:hypothetical protein
VSGPATITLTSGGPRNAHTDPETGLRYYDWRGQKLPSTTSLRRMAGVPFTLHQWALSRVIERATEEHVLLEAMMSRPKRPRERVRDKNVRKEAGRWLRSAATEERDAAAELGTLVHDLAVARVALQNVADPDAAPFLGNFYDWLDVSGVHIIATEQQVFAPTLGYAGTFDLLVEFPNGDIGVIDLKTGRGTWPEHALQLVSYALAEFVGADDVIDVALTAALHRANTMALLHLRADGWEYQRIPADAQMFDAFKGLISFAVWMAKHPTLVGLIDDEQAGGIVYP